MADGDTITILDASNTQHRIRLQGIDAPERGQDMNIRQIQAGLAWHYKKYQREQSTEDRRLYADAEVMAREARRGLWQEADPVAPWAWRKRKAR